MARLNKPTGTPNRPALVIAGSGRSGTTWVLDVIAAANDLRPIFEALHPKSHAKAGAFANRYIRPDDSVPELQELLGGVFSGNHRSIWSDFRINNERLTPFLKQPRITCRTWMKLVKRYREYGALRNLPQPIVKFIRANLMLGWIRKTFGARIVLLLRHPGAVIESKLRGGSHVWDPYPLIDQYRNDKLLWEDYLQKYAFLFKERLSPVEAHAIIWCVENQLPLAQAQEYGFVVVHYEHLVQRPTKYWKHVVQGLGASREPDVVLTQLPSQQSSVRLRRESVPCADDDGWYDRISMADKSRINDIMQAMEVSVYDCFKPLPLDNA